LHATKVAELQNPHFEEKDMSVRVVHGANDGHFSAGGQTVGRVAHVLRDVFNVPADASALVNGKDVRRNHMLADGDTLEFVRTFGQKGGIHDYWSENELMEFFGEDEVEQMKNGGMKLTNRPVLSADEVMSWGKWLRDRQHDPSLTIPVRVDIKNTAITVSGKTFDIDQQMAAVVQCLIEARGHRCTTKEMRKEYPRYILDERLDLTINRKLRPHRSGIGKFIKSDKHGFRLDVSKCE
jgi:hypothetical protein